MISRSTTPGPNVFSQSDPRTSPLGSILLKCLARLKSWKPPPNWSASDWFDELQQLAYFAACEAVGNYRVCDTTSPEAFVYSRIMGNVLTCYRREWGYALRFVPEPLSDLVADNDEQSEHVNLLEAEAPDPALHHELIDEALANLPPPERYVIEELFWAGRTEQEIGQMLGMNRRRVNRWKQTGLQHLRDQLTVWW
jgi:RNA polymerase sigma factor (sigma-70 family)